MTKLMEWLILFSCIFTVWVALVTKKVNYTVPMQYEVFILYAPVILIIMFGLYAATSVLIGTCKFVDCKQAADSLQKEILEARKDLEKRGFQFVSSKQ